MGQIFHDPEFRAVTEDGTPIVVELHVFYREDNRTVVVISHRDDEPSLPAKCGGHCVEAITNRLADELGYDFDFVIEHFPARSPQAGEETFDLVQLQCEKTSGHYRLVRSGQSWPWQHLSRQTAEAITGEPI